MGSEFDRLLLLGDVTVDLVRERDGAAVASTVSAEPSALDCTTRDVTRCKSSGTNPSLSSWRFFLATATAADAFQSSSGSSSRNESLEKAFWRACLGDGAMVA